MGLCSPSISDNIGRVSIYTSATRPASGDDFYVGKIIYESDTARTMQCVSLAAGGRWMVLAEPEVTFSPAWTNITVGAGTSFGRYHRSDGWIDVEMYFLFGVGSAVSGTVSVTLPKTAATSYSMLWQGHILDSGTAWFDVRPYTAASTTTLSIEVINATGTYTGGSALSSIVPMTWTTNDGLFIAGRYRMANRYD